MDKIEIKKKNGVVIVTNKIIKPEVVIVSEHNIVNREFKSYLVSTEHQIGKKYDLLTAKMVNVVPLKEYVAQLCSLDDYILLVNKILDIIMVCIDNKLDTGNLFMSMEGTFINPTTKELKMIYWPLINNSDSSKIHDFLINLALGIKNQIVTSTKTIQEYNKYLGSIETGFSVKLFKKFWEELINDSKHKNKNTSQKTMIDEDILYYNPFKNIVQNNSQTYRKRKKCPLCGIDVGNDVIQCVNCGTKFLNNTSKIKTNTKDTQDFSTQSNSINQGKSLSKKSITYLIRKKNSDKILINKSLIKLGKERTCDYRITDNNAVSRIHAYIVVEAGNIFIIDNASTNKTYVNGKPIKPGVKIKIKYNDEIKLGNEIFVLNVERTLGSQ